MTYARFEEIPAWQEAIRLADAAFGLTVAPAWKNQFSLRGQLEFQIIRWGGFLKQSGKAEKNSRNCDRICHAKVAGSKQR